MTPVSTVIAATDSAIFSFSSSKHQNSRTGSESGSSSLSLRLLVDETTALVEVVVAAMVGHR